MHIDTQLKNLIKGKRVAIIGPADYVNKELGEEHGKYLDESFDIVIRLNSMIHIENKEMLFYEAYLLDPNFHLNQKSL